MKEQAFKINFFISEFIEDGFYDIFGRMEAIKNLEEILPILEDYINQIKEFIKKNGKKKC